MGCSAALKYEFRMQVRRPAVWIVLLLLAGATGGGAIAHLPPVHLQPAALAGTWAYRLQMFAPAAFGCLLADRVGRERRFRVAEVFAALPAAPGRLLLGKYLGAAGATALPIALVFAAGALVLAAGHGAAVLPWALAAFALVILPGLLFVAAFSVGCPTVMPVVLYQFLFVGYWFWGNLLNAHVHIPTISATMLTPVGGYAAEALFHGAVAAIPAAVPASSAWASVALLLGLAGVALYLTERVLAGQGRAASGRPPSQPPPTRAAAGRAAPRIAGRAGGRLRYELRILGPGVLTAPPVIVGVFAAMALVAALARQGDAVPRLLTSALEVGVSLGAGLAAANLVAGEPAAELHLALPAGYRGTALLRLAIATAWACAVALAFSCVLAATGAWLTGEPLGASALVWAAPTLWLSAIGALLALALRSRAASVGMVAAIFLAEFMLHGTLDAVPWLRPVQLFATTFARGAPWWLANRLELVAGAAVLFVLVWYLLGNTEAFVGSPHE